MSSSSSSAEATAFAAASAARTVAPPRLRYPAAFLLVAVNLLVFAVMLPGSAIATAWQQHHFGELLTIGFRPDTLWRFGASDAYSVLGQHQWWRPVTATFVHASALHLLLNMWCLWNLGVFGEPLLGRPGLVSVYLLTGTAGNFLSMIWNQLRGRDVLVVGASGAVFGIAGILIVLLSNRKLALPWSELRALRRQVILFAVVNLLFGAGPGLLPLLGPASLHAMHVTPDRLPEIDNSAHLGGFLFGMALGLPLFPRMTSGASSYRQRQRLTFVTAALSLCLVGYALSRFAR
jgi:rhomboid protease GluP